MNASTSPDASAPNAEIPPGAARARRGSPAAVGGLALGLVLAGIALSNTTLALQGAWIDAPSWADSLVSLALASSGVVLVWRGLGATDPAASIVGYAGGALIWMGFFEWTWRNFSVWLGIDMLIVDGTPTLPGSFLLVQATAFIFVPLTILIAANKDTRCRMMLWFRRRLHLQVPDTRGNRHRHHPSRVSATETVFVIWFIYLFNIALYDPRLLGGSQPVFFAVLALVGLWAAFLVWRLLRIPGPGMAVRYAIPTAYLLSVLFDSMTQLGLFPAYWILPLQYPLFPLAMVAIFVACSYALLKIGSSAGETARD